MKAGALRDLNDVWKPLDGIDDEKRNQRDEKYDDGDWFCPAILIRVAEKNEQDVTWQQQEIAEMELDQYAEQDARKDQPPPPPVDCSAQQRACVQKSKEQGKVRMDRPVAQGDDTLGRDEGKHREQGSRRPTPVA